MADSLTKAEDALKDPECAPPYRGEAHWLTPLPPYQCCMSHPALLEQLCLACITKACTSYQLSAKLAILATREWETVD